MGLSHENKKSPFHDIDKSEQEKLLIIEGFLYIFLFIIDSTKMQTKTEENAIRADPVSHDFLIRFKNKSDSLLKKLGIDKDKEFQIIFGLKKFSLRRGFGHRAVIVKLLDEKKVRFDWNLTYTNPMLMGNNISLVNITARGIRAIFKTNHTQNWLITILKSTYLKEKSFLGDAAIVILTISHYFASMFMKITETLKP